MKVQKSIYHASESSLLLFCDGVTLVYICRLYRWNPVLYCSLLLSSFSLREDVVLSLLSGHWHPVCVFVCLCRHPTCVCARMYVGTTCYSQGWSSLRPVSLCVYSSGGLLPPDYKKDWWINNIQLSLALSHTLWGLEVSVCLCVCVCVRVLPCVCAHMCPYMHTCVCAHDVYVYEHLCLWPHVSHCVCVCVCVSGISQWTRLSFI